MHVPKCFCLSPPLKATSKYCKNGPISFICPLPQSLFYLRRLQKWRQQSPTSMHLHLFIAPPCPVSTSGGENVSTNMLTLSFAPRSAFLVRWLTLGVGQEAVDRREASLPRGDSEGVVLREAVSLGNTCTPREVMESGICYHTHRNRHRNACTHVHVNTTQHKEPNSNNSIFKILTDKQRYHVPTYRSRELWIIWKTIFLFSSHDYKAWFPQESRIMYLDFAQLNESLNSYS